MKDVGCHAGGRQSRYSPPDSNVRNRAQPPRTRYHRRMFEAFVIAFIIYFSRDRPGRQRADLS